MRPAQLLDMQADLLDRFTDRRFREIQTICFTSDYAAASTGRSAAQPGHRRLMAKVQANAVYLVDSHINHLRHADAYRITEPMVDLLNHLVEHEIDATDEFQHRLAPSPTGIVRFDKPILVHEVRGRVMKAHWLVWGPIQAQTASGEERPVTIAVWYNDATDPDEVGMGTDISTHASDEYVQQVMGRWRWIGAEYMQDGHPIGDALEDLPEAVAAEVAAEGEVPAAKITRLSKYLYGVWLLMGQTIAAKDVEEPDRAGARRAIRKSLPPRVTVVRLRRREHRPAEGAVHVEWQHQWIVKQHLRWQPYGPRVCTHDGGHEWGPVQADPGRLYRACLHCAGHLDRITIDPYVKGPAGAPLKQSRKVYSVEQ